MIASINSCADSLLRFSLVFIIMHELRKDYLIDEYVIIATTRSQRPHQLKHVSKRSPKSACPFCPEHEDWTPKEISRYPKNAKKWRKRVVPNKFPAVQTHGKLKRINRRFTKAMSAIGSHEVIIETPDHNKDLCDLSINEIAELLQIYKERFLEIRKKRNIKEVVIFKNQGVSGGASLSHAHSQIIATNKVCGRLEAKIKAFNEYKRNFKSCPYCEIIKEELKSNRRVYNGKHVACFTPFASRAAYELLIFPKKHIADISEMDDAMIKELACVLKRALFALKKINADFNYFIHMPVRGDFHMHMDIMPRVILRAGFEEATECIVNIVSPEDAAKFYRRYFKGLKCQK